MNVQAAMPEEPKCLSEIVKDQAEARALVLAPIDPLIEALEGNGPKDKSELSLITITDDNNIVHRINFPYGVGKVIVRINHTTTILVGVMLGVIQRRLITHTGRLIHIEVLILRIEGIVVIGITKIHTEIIRGEESMMTTVEEEGSTMTIVEEEETMMTMAIEEEESMMTMAIVEEEGTHQSYPK